MIHLQNLRPEPLLPNGIQPDSQTFATAARFELGKRYLVIATSGKGKSTLLHIIYGLRQDYTGTVRVGEREARQLAPDDWSELRQRQFSIVFQNLRLFADLTARENIALQNALTDHKTTAEIEAMAERLGVRELLDKPAGQLSYGQRQRMAIIRALCQPFQFLLLDEPFSHLDEGNTKAACALIEEELAAQGAGLILVSLGERYYLTFDVELRL